VSALRFFLEQGVVDDLRDVLRLTEAATVRVLDETEALVDDGHAAARLLEDLRSQAAAADAQALDPPMRALSALVERSHARAMAIMAALEFHDVTCQKVERTFAVLDDVLARLAKIQRLVDTRETRVAPPAPVFRRIALDGRPGQRLADELLVRFAATMDG
jgi:hypothetical protein